MSEWVTNKGEIVIRRQRWLDRPAVEAVFEAALQEGCCRVYSPQQLQVLRQTNNPRQYRSHFVLVAETERQVVGFTSLWGRTLQAMYVHPHYTRRGIGRALLREMELYVASRQIWRLKVTASLNAEPFYRACGFEVLKQTVTRYTGFEGIELPVTNMAKTLRWSPPLPATTNLSVGLMGNYR